MRPIPRLSWPLLALLLAAPGAAQNAPAFHIVGDLPGGAVSSTAAAVSADASTVVGWSEGSSGIEAFVWTEAGGLVGIGQPAASEPFSRASGVSDDGSVVAGTVATNDGGRAFRWTSGGGFVSLGTFGCFLCTDNATGEAISGDGSTVVGSGLEVPFLGSARVNAARWPGGGTGISDLGDLSGGGDAGIAQGASRDGSLIVGEADAGAGPSGFRWSGSMTSLPGLAGALHSVGALGVAADESVIVGYANASASSTNQAQPVRWVGPSFATAENLGALPGQSSARGRAYAASGDGSVIVGTTRDASGSDTAFLWDAAGGMRSLATELEQEYGLDLGGYTLSEARDVSDIDGAGEFTVVGIARSPAGDSLGFVAVLSPTHCNDGLDNDGDLLVDHPADPGCTAPGDRSEGPDCSDGLDNDGDGWVDYPADPECTSPLDGSERADCGNGIDDDGDGLADFPADPGCRSAQGQEEAPACDDGVDNDGDLAVDFPADAQCLDPSDTSERDDCSDGVDNDGDGLVDFPADPDCDAPDDPAEDLACADFVDNDGDGRVDYPDAYPHCRSALDAVEAPECSDAADNDGDGDTDHPADAQCPGPQFLSEAPGVLAEGDLLVVDQGSASLWALDPSSGAESLLSQGALMQPPQGVAQREGRLVVATPGGLLEVGAATGEQHPRSGALDSLGDLPMAVDSSGDVLVLEATGITRVDWLAGGSGSQTPLLPVPVGASELQFFVGNTLALADDQTAYTTGFGLLGDGVYVADLLAGTVAKVTPGFLGHVWRDLALESPTTLVAVGAHQPQGEGVFRIDVATGAISALNTDPTWQQLDAVAVAADGSLYVADSGSCDAGACSGGLVARVDPSSGARTVIRQGLFSGLLQLRVAGALARACDDGVDDDGDGLVDFPADPGCKTLNSDKEAPACDDDVDNDGDGKVDWDGGLAGATPDPQCSNKPWKTSEKSNCGLGFELVGLLPLWMALRRRRLRAAR